MRFRKYLMLQLFCILFFNETKGEIIASGIYYYNGTHTVPTPNKHECVVS